MRRDSGDLHHALDTRLSLCDLTTPDGLARFLKATEHGLAPLAATQAPSAPLAADLLLCAAARFRKLRYAIAGLLSCKLLNFYAMV